LVIATLLAAGADVEARDNHGMTALMHAVKYNQNHEVVTTLLKAGADAKAKNDKGNTVL
jgi:ankyrin repeat protein